MQLYTILAEKNIGPTRINLRLVVFASQEKCQQDGNDVRGLG